MWYNDALEYIIGQRAIYTLHNENSGNRFTYKTKQSKKNSNFLNIYVLTGPNNTRDYTLLGYINKSTWSFNPSKFSSISSDAQSFKVFEWVYNRLRSNSLPEYIKAIHYNTCCRCGKVLTRPHTIAAGIGDDCAVMRQFSMARR